MKILAIDIGTGTQDILLYDTRLHIENGYKLVVPSPTMIVRRRIKQATQEGKPVLLTGLIMGGGPSHWAAEDHIKAGLPLYATPSAARSFNDELDGNGQLKAFEARLVKLERMEKNLQSLYMEEEISLADFKEHRSHIEAERSRLKTNVDSIRQRQHLVKADFEVALQLATQFDFLYRNGNFDQRRLLCETVLKRLHVEDGKIVKPEYNAPFAIIARANGSGTVNYGGRYRT